ncbi:MAG TPA: hypothetical protein VLB84_13850 [Bacteroidia bacterium]|nr:hypothetical protein [Bacteroidia bacterium]
MKKLVLIFTMGFLSSCNMLDDQSKVASEENKITNEYAKVSTKKGMLVFIESTPANKYEILETVNSKAFVDQVQASNKHKKALRAILDMGITTFKNLSYNEKLTMLVDSAMAQYEGTEGIIISNDLLSCTAIKFKAE